MKKSLQIFALLFCIIVFAQAPEKFSYQAVIRNASNALITNANVGMKISILKTSAAGTVVYAESQTATTNINGLVSIQIGAGTPITGTIAAIDWSADSYYIKTETDPAGGTSYSIAGTTQLLSVPYALYSKNSGSSGSGLTLPYIATGTNASALFQLTNNGDGPSIEGISNSVTDGISSIKGVVSSTAPGGFSTAVRGINNGTNVFGIGVWGSHAGGGYGVYGTAPTGYAVIGETNTGIAGYFSSMAAGRALITDGPITFASIGEGAGKVLTSDAAGNATWQNVGTPKVHFSSVEGSSQAINNTVYLHDINSWTGLEEAGGANYNPVTGEYTIPVTGYYSVKARITFAFSNTKIGPQAGLRIFVDYAIAKQGFSNNSIVGEFYTDMTVDFEKSFSAGQKIKVTVNQDGSVNNVLFAPGCNFSIHLIHQ